MTIEEEEEDGTGQQVSMVVEWGATDAVEEDGAEDATVGSTNSSGNTRRGLRREREGVGGRGGGGGLDQMMPGDLLRLPGMQGPGQISLLDLVRQGEQQPPPRRRRRVDDANGTATVRMDQQQQQQNLNHPGNQQNNHVQGHNQQVVGGRGNQHHFQQQQQPPVRIQAIMSNANQMAGNDADFSDSD